MSMTRAVSVSELKQKREMESKEMNKFHAVCGDCHVLQSDRDCSGNYEMNIALPAYHIGLLVNLLMCRRIILVDMYLQKL